MKRLMEWMKRVMFLVAFVLFLCPMFLLAEDVVIKSVEVQKTPPLKQGAIWDLKNHVVKYIMTTELASWKGVCLEGGYVDPAGLVGVLSYRVFALKQLGLNIPLLDYVEFNLGFGGGVKYATEKNEGFYGASITLINVKF